MAQGESKNLFCFLKAVQETCNNPTRFYCPRSIRSYTVTVTRPGNGVTGQDALNTGNTGSLFAGNSGQNWAFNNLAGDSGTDPSTDYFDFGLPFFYGRSVFVGIENMTGPGGVVGPYYAY